MLLGKAVRGQLGGLTAASADIDDEPHRRGLGDRDEMGWLCDVYQVILFDGCEGQLISVVQDDRSLSRRQV